MTLPGGPPEAPPRRRTPWSFKTIVEDVGGRPLAEFQEPPPGKLGTPRRNAEPRGAEPPPPLEPDARRDSGRERPSEGRTEDPAAVPIPASAAEPLEEPPLDPVARVYPPLSGSTGRSLHGSEAEHHVPTLRSVEGPEEGHSPGARAHPPGPSRRPERIYLHYLLLHLDRLNDGALQYLKHAVDEETEHRSPPAL
jgi:hypothetical protein